MGVLLSLFFSSLFLCCCLSFDFCEENEKTFTSLELPDVAHLNDWSKMFV